MRVTNRKNELDAIREALGKVIRGKPRPLELVLTAVLAGGHVLLEDVPGVGKTTLAKALANALGLDFARVQFTPDLMPTDILGMNVLNPKEGTFSFRPGPVFHQILLADEINRASPRTQSALLEAMNEGQVTLDDATRPLPTPFFVIATQNPVDCQGVYPLPEAQLDRFLLRVSVGYPDRADELKMLFDRQLTDPLETLTGVVDAGALVDMLGEVRAVHLSEDVGKYILNLVEATRRHPDLELGASPRGSLALFRAAQAAAFLAGKDYVAPSDVQGIASGVLAHRVLLSTEARYGGKSATDIIAGIIAGTEVPR
jgi:MoxR-like ATPase